MKHRTKISAERREVLVNHLLARLRVILLERNPQMEQCVVLIRQYIAECNVDQEAWTQDATVYDLGMPQAIATAFYDAGYKSVRSLIACTEADLMRVEGFGPKMIRQLKESLAKQQLYLKGGEPLLQRLNFDFDFDEEF